MHKVLLLACVWLVAAAVSVCSSTAPQLPSAFAPFLTASRTSQSQETDILQLYQSLTQLDNYSVAMTSPYAIFHSRTPTCNRQSLPNVYNAHSDIWVCLDEFYLLSCSREWELLIECGTLLEVHRPFDPTPLVRLNLQTAAWVVDKEGNKVTNMGIRQLCAGNYHLWFVYYARTGQFLKGVKTIYIDSPSCNC